MKEGSLVQMLDRQRVHQASADEAKKLVDAASLAAERLVDGTKEAEETATAAAAAAALSAPEEAQVFCVRVMEKTSTGFWLTSRDNWRINAQPSEEVCVACCRMRRGACQILRVPTADSGCLNCRLMTMNEAALDRIHNRRERTRMQSQRK
jgi:hypothetical protein